MLTLQNQSSPMLRVTLSLWKEATSFFPVRCHHTQWPPSSGRKKETVLSLILRIQTESYRYLHNFLFILHYRVYVLRYHTCVIYRHIITGTVLSLYSFERRMYTHTASQLQLQMVDSFVRNYRWVEARGVLSSLAGFRSTRSALMMQGCTRVLPGTPLAKHLPLHDYGFYTQVCMIYTHTQSK